MFKKISLFIVVIIALIISIFYVNSNLKKNIKPEKVKLKILAWEGYADLKFVKQFENKFNVDVEVRYLKNDDELWNLIINDKADTYDLIAANTAEINRFIKNDLLEEINEKEITNLKIQKDIFKNTKLFSEIFHKNKRYAIPYAYAEMGLIYNKNIIKDPPTSMLDLLNKKYKGQVLIYDTYQHNFTFMALALGIKDPFNLNENDFNLVTNKLIELKSNIIGFYSTLEEATKIYREFKVALVYANFGNQQLIDLIRTGANVGYVIPKESALAWLDCWAILKVSKHKELAQKWIDFTLSNEVSLNLKTNHGLSNTISSELNESNLTWLRAISDPERRIKTWNNIVEKEKQE